MIGNETDSHPRHLVLVVEDNARNRRLAEMVLRPHFRLAFAEDGETALQQVGRLHPDLVLLDIQIPKIDGLEVVRRLKADEATRRIPVVALTSYAMEADRERILQAGCDGYLAKPIDTRTLPQDVARYLGGDRCLDSDRPGKDGNTT